MDLTYWCPIFLEKEIREMSGRGERRKKELEREGKIFEILDATVPEAHRPLALLS